jgi:hypothetical protein
LIFLLAGLAGCSQISSLAETFRKPSAPFSATPAPPAPDYGRRDAWMAFPGDGGMERSAPPGASVVAEASAPADLFFIHPTTYLKNDVYNAHYDAPNDAAVFNAPVLLQQVSAFNACCRLYAPQYRQASLYSLSHSRPANEIAFADVQRAFRWYIAHENHGRPFILASHSQGSGIAIRLLQTDILGTPLQKQMVAAYVVGAYVPSTFAELGLPTCDAPAQTDCIVAWNTAQTGRNAPATVLFKTPSYWWRGAVRIPAAGTAPAPICVNALTWREAGAAPAAANAGAMPFPKPPFPKAAVTLPPLASHLTGAECRKGLLYVDIPRSAKGYGDTLTLLYGSYHAEDYGIFYASVRQNAVDRVAAWTAAPAPTSAVPASPH